MVAGGLCRPAAALDLPGHPPRHSASASARDDGETSWARHHRGHRQHPRESTGRRCRSTSTIVFSPAPLNAARQHPDRDGAGDRGGGGNGPAAGHGGLRLNVTAVRARLLGMRSNAILGRDRHGRPLAAAGITWIAGTARDGGGLSPPGTGRRLTIPWSSVLVPPAGLLAGFSGSGSSTRGCWIVDRRDRCRPRTLNRLGHADVRDGDRLVPARAWWPGDGLAVHRHLARCSASSAPGCSWGRRRRNCCATNSPARLSWINRNYQLEINI